MTYLKRSVDGTVSEYAPMDVMSNPEFVKSLPHARETFDQPHAYCGRDEQGRLWVNGKGHAPTWEEIIEGYLVWPVQDVFRDPVTHAVTYGPLHYWTRAEAESKAARVCPELVPQLATEAAA